MSNYTFLSTKTKQNKATTKGSRNATNLIAISDESTFYI